MRAPTQPRRRAALGAGLAGLLAATAAALPITAITAGAATTDGRADVQPFLRQRLDGIAAGVPSVVMVHGRSLDAAEQAVRATGMQRVTSFDRIGVVVAVASEQQVEAARSQPGVTYLEGNPRLAYTTETSHQATRGLAASERFDGRDGSRLDGSGVSVGVIDSGVDPTHPFLTNKDGSSAVVRNLKVVCEPLTETRCEVVDAGADTDTDTASGGGHGTHVSGIVAGRPTKLASGETLRGAAPGADLVSLSTGAVLFIVGADASLNWVLEHHEKPCGPRVSAKQCPPIKVTNNSYGPSGGGSFDRRSATVKLQRALAEEGVLTVWANGNDGGDGSENLSNPPGQDPTPGILSVASYFDKNTGTRGGVVSDYSSRGLRSNVSTYPDISAPGEDITSSCRIYLSICGTGLDPREGGDYNTISGTSMAAPHIAGIVAQLFEAAPQAGPQRIEQSLELTAHRYTDGAGYRSDPNGGVTSYDKGHGLVDVVAAYERLTGR